MNRNRKEWSSSRVSRKVIFTENVLKTHKWIRTSWQKRWVFEMIRKSKREFTSLFQFAWGGCALAFGFRLFTYYRYWFYTTFTLKLRDLRNLPCYFRLHLKTVWYMPIDNLKATKKLWTPSSTLFKKRALYSCTLQHVICHRKHTLSEYVGFTPPFQSQSVFCPCKRKLADDPPFRYLIIFQYPQLHLCLGRLLVPTG